MFSSASLHLVADNFLKEVLRLCTTMEMYIYADFYCKHPVFLKLISENSGFTSINSLLCMSTSYASVDSGLSGIELVRAEAVANCKNFRKWSGFLFLLALSSVISRRVISCYPDIGLDKFKVMFSQEICPRTSIKSFLNFHILFCYERELSFRKNFQHNHYVPLIFVSHGKHKSPRSLQTEPNPKKRCNGSSFVPKKICFKPNNELYLSKPKVEKAPSSIISLVKPLSNTSLFTFF